MTIAINDNDYIMVKRLIIIMIVWHAFVKAFVVVVDWAHIKCEIMKKNVFNTLGDKLHSH